MDARLLGDANHMLEKENYEYLLYVIESDNFSSKPWIKLKIILSNDNVSADLEKHVNLIQFTRRWWTYDMLPSILK